MAKVKEAAEGETALGENRSVCFYFPSTGIESPHVTKPGLFIFCFQMWVLGPKLRSSFQGLNSGPLLQTEASTHGWRKRGRGDLGVLWAIETKTLSSGHTSL